MKLYIDPGTGSMLFTILIGVLGALVYAFRNILMKAKFTLSGGKKVKDINHEYPYVFFSDGKQYWNVFKPVCDEMEKREQKVLYLTAAEDDLALLENYQYIRTEFAGNGNRAFARMNMISADIVLSSTPGLDVYQWKRSRNVKWYVHIPHGIYDLTAYRMFGLDYYDAVLLVAEFQERAVRQLEKRWGLPAKEMLVVGMTYMDTMLARLQADQEKEKQEMELSPEETKSTTVLLASSWGSSSLLARYGDRIFDALLKTDHRIIVRPHPQSFLSEKEMIDRLMEKYPESDRLTWDRNSDNYHSLKQADLLIADFSGIIIDCAFIFEKPVIYADISFDKAPYDAYWVDEPMWRFEVLKKIGMQLNEENVGEITELIEQCISSSELKENIKEAREEAWKCIGNSAKNVADYLMLTRERLNESAI